MSSSIQTAVIGHAILLTLNAPERGNAFSDKLVEDLDAALDSIADAQCHTVIFRGAGKGFCGGLDLSNLESESDASLLTRLIRIEMLLQRIARLPQRTIALAHRFAFGAGADLMLACRHRIASPGTKLSFPGVRFGIALGTGRLSRLVGPDKAQALLMRVAPIGTEEAHECGMISELLPEADWEARIAHLANETSSLNPRMAHIVAACLNPGQDDADLAALVRSAALPGLHARVVDYVAQSAALRARK